MQRTSFARPHNLAIYEFSHCGSDWRFAKKLRKFLFNLMDTLNTLQPIPSVEKGRHGIREVAIGLWIGVPLFTNVFCGMCRVGQSNPLVRFDLLDDRLKDGLQSIGAKLLPLVDLCAHRREDN